MNLDTISVESVFIVLLIQGKKIYYWLRVSSTKHIISEFNKCMANAMDMINGGGTIVYLGQF